MEACDPLKLIVNKTLSVKGVIGRRRFALFEPLPAVSSRNKPEQHRTQPHPANNPSPKLRKQPKISLTKNAFASLLLLLLSVQKHSLNQPAFCQMRLQFSYLTFSQQLNTKGVYGVLFISSLKVSSSIFLFMPISSAKRFTCFT